MISDPSKRAAALQQYAILDTAPEPAFDDLTRLTSFICDTPIALVSLLDTSRQWFKSRVGLDAQETPIEQSFCAHAVQQDGIFSIHDATHDERFEHNPLVTGGPNIRFYAGAPLVSPEGVAIGTLCAIDRVPRQLTPEQTEALGALSRQVMRMMELRRTVNALQSALFEVAAAKQEISQLQGILPMCCYCRKVRNDSNFWQGVEEYLANHTDLRFSHGFCPECEDRARQEMGLAAKKRD